MPMYTCGSCGRLFLQRTGRPAKTCEACRDAESLRYGYEHQKRRAATIGEAYGQNCTRCGFPLIDGQEIHLDHVDGNPDEYLGFAHARCNEQAGGRRSAELLAAAQVPPEPVVLPPDRPEIEHGADCRCVEKAASWGAWPSRCW